MTDEKIDAKRLAEAMQLAWNEYCYDTGNHPPDFKQCTKTGVPVVRGVQLFAKFEEHGPFVSHTASWYEVLGKGDKVTRRRREPLPAGGRACRNRKDLK